MEKINSSRYKQIIWVVYQNPSDFPGKTVARKFEIPGGATEEVIVKDLESMRSHFKDKLSLYRVPRFHLDDPCIVESWI